MPSSIFAGSRLGQFSTSRLAGRPAGCAWLAGSPAAPFLREMGGAPRNPAPRNHFLVWIVKSPGCHCTDAFGGKKYRRVPTPPRSTFPFSDFPLGGSGQRSDSAGPRRVGLRGRRTRWGRCSASLGGPKGRPLSSQVARGSSELARCILAKSPKMIKQIHNNYQNHQNSFIKRNE